MPSETGVLAIIPAKMTSRRLPGKNMALLMGRPLLYYTVVAAQLTPGIDRIVVSSEDEDVLALANDLGVGLRRRPPELSAHHVRNDMVIRDALQVERDAGFDPELVVLLQPTHPLRAPRDIEHGVAMMRECPEADCLFTVAREDVLLGQIDAEGFYRPEVPLPRDKSKEPHRYRNTGSFYVFRTMTTFDRGGMFGGKVLPLVLDHPEFEVDIDLPEDLEVAEALLQRHQEQFMHFFGGDRP